MREKDYNMEKILDVRDMTPKDRHSKIFGTFRGLKPGGSFVFVNDHDPKPLLYQFQAEHHGDFDWWPLEQGPHVWRVMISKREVNDPKRTVTEFLQTDHNMKEEHILYPESDEFLSEAERSEVVKTAQLI